jgi:hypothetical protein
MRTTTHAHASSFCFSAPKGIRCSATCEPLWAHPQLQHSQVSVPRRALGALLLPLPPSQPDNLPLNLTNQPFSPHNSYDFHPPALSPPHFRATPFAPKTGARSDSGLVRSRRSQPPPWYLPSTSQLTSAFRSHSPFSGPQPLAPGRLPLEHPRRPETGHWTAGKGRIFPSEKGG